MKYNPKKIELKWQRKWAKDGLYEIEDQVQAKNYMLLTEFPYPSGNLHIGHWYAFALPDILARYLRAKGNNVMYPIGFDAFGLPAENAAIQRGINPRDWTKKNIAHMTKQLGSMGASFDWTRQVSTIDPEYYKWTQWMFLKMYEKGLAYRAKTKVNWCPKDKTVLANEQVVNGGCDRCGTPVEQRDKEQWMFKITAYADRLLAGLEKVDWPEATKLAQRNWIGKSQGALIKFPLVDVPTQTDGEHVVEVFTTRPDTIFGVTFIVISPELAKLWLDAGWQASSEVRKYIESSLKRRELDRVRGVEAPTPQEGSGSRPESVGNKTGVAAGINAINPVNSERISVWIADYVVGSYGTGAIMAVPSHDERDNEFAKKFNLPISQAPLLDSKEAMEIIKNKGAGEAKTNYRLHDWILSRQRYWGVPIPMIYCADCGWQPVSENKLPIKLPKLEDYLPTDEGKSPLAKVAAFVKVKCPKCSGNAERETDTMDTFVDSSWYYLRYTDPKNKTEFAASAKMKEWLPVPMYVGGAEHNTMHLLYSRFFAKALHDLGYIDFDEPFLARRNHGIVLGPDGHKMSKSKGNVIDPDDLVVKFGADTVRMYLAFMAPYEQGGPWDPKGINGVARFLNRVWNMAEDSELDKVFIDQGIVHRAIKKIGEDITELHFNTGVSELMKLLNYLEGCTFEAATFETFLKLLAPFAPHLTEEIWQNVLGKKTSIHLESWPIYNERLIMAETMSLPVQVNGRVRGAVTVPSDTSEDDIKEAALAVEGVKKHTAGRHIEKVIYISRRMVSVVTK